MSKKAKHRAAAARHRRLSTVPGRVLVLDDLQDLECEFWSDVCMVVVVDDAAGAYAADQSAWRDLVADLGSEGESVAWSHGEEYGRRRAAVHHCVRAGRLDSLARVLHGSYWPRKGGWFVPSLNFPLMCGGTHRSPAVIFPGGVRDDDEITHIAAQTGSLLILEWAHLNKLPMHPEVYKAAAAGGHLKVLRRLEELGVPLGSGDGAIYAAAESGSVEALKVCVRLAGGWARGSFNGNVRPALRAAARHGRVEMVQHIMDTMAEECRGVRDEIAGLAAESGHRPLLEWAVAQQLPILAEVMTALAARGDIPTMEWARARTPPFPWDARASRAAVQGKQVEAFVWLARNGAPIARDTCMYSVAHFADQSRQQWEALIMECTEPMGG